MSVSCAPSKRWKFRQSARNCTPRVPRRWMPTDDFAACANNLASPPGGLTKLVPGWCTVACGRALLPAAHVVSAELQDVLYLHRNATDVDVQRKINTTIWRMRRKERRRKAVAMVPSAVETRRAPGPVLCGLNWSKVLGAQAVVADKVIADFFAEICDLKG